MRAVVQRVKNAGVSVGGEMKSGIARGLLVFLGVEESDTPADCDYICDKIAGLRIFEDAGGKMNLSVTDVCGEVLLVSQFTLYGDARKGRRPSFIRAARPEKAVELYERAAERLSKSVPVETGEFRTDMEVSLVNDGPVTILLDSGRLF